MGNETKSVKTNQSSASQDKIHGPAPFASSKSKKSTVSAKPAVKAITKAAPAKSSPDTSKPSTAKKSASAIAKNASAMHKHSSKKTETKEPAKTQVTKSETVKASATTAAKAQSKSPEPKSKNDKSTSSKSESALIKPKNRVPMKTKKSKSKSKVDTSKIVIKDAEIVPAGNTIAKADDAKAQSADTPDEPTTPKTSETLGTPSDTPAAKKSTSEPQNTNQETKVKQDMKLPLIRRLHIKVRYIVSGAIVLLLAIFFGRVAIWEKNYLERMTGSDRYVAESVASNQPVYDGGSEVDDTEPTPVQVAEYHVAPNRPRYLTIRMLGIRNARVVEISRNANGELGTPVNIYNVGWYNGSAIPGNNTAASNFNGVAVMDAHGGDLGNGIFKNLPKINIGDEIEIEMGDEVTKYTYVVKDIALKPIGADANNFMNTAFTSPVAGSASLTLITCTGDWLQAQQTYNKRLFVRAVLKQS